MLSKTILSVVVVGVFTMPVRAQTIWHVDDDAPLGGDGTTWSTAYKYLQDALAAATNGDEIRVAGGTYKPDQDEAGNVTLGERIETFQLISGVELYGGYAGLTNPSDPNARDIETHETVFSGDLGTLGDSSDNAYHVVTGSETDHTAVRDGFRITEGNANGGGLNNHGGGMHNDAGNPTLSNCRFTGNSAYHYGGGMYNNTSSPALANCAFAENSSSYGKGGGMHNDNGSSPTVNNCTFSGNSTSSPGTGGAGMSNYNGSDPTLDNCTFEGNEAHLLSLSSTGGGMSNPFSTVAF
ncbi:MAG: right-handed parallel beta-helix repeat-containing protein [Phycisphaerales bacterium]|nr:MAG: right-handed parallel beta-helix repeat-containing protein [Phycisphaerales bacterium]